MLEARVWGATSLTLCEPLPLCCPELTQCEGKGCQLQNSGLLTRQGLPSPASAPRGARVCGLALAEGGQSSRPKDMAVTEVGALGPHIRGEFPTIPSGYSRQGAGSAHT